MRELAEERTIQVTHESRLHDDWETGSLRMPAGERVRRRLFAAYLIFVGVFTVAFGAGLARGKSNFIIGDWLINYSGGFVRRGLIGTPVLWAGHLTHAPLEWIVYSIQVSLFLLFLVCVYRLADGIRWTYLMAAVVVSPATLAFTVIEQYAGMRKEILLFALLAGVLCLLITGRMRDWQLSAVLGVVVVVLALSHEALVVCAPYLFAAVAIKGRSLRRAMRICVVPLLLALVAMAAVLLHPGNAAIARAVCDSVGGTLVPLGSPNPSFCSGSIVWLEITLDQARPWVLDVVHRLHSVRLFGLLAIPTFAPIVAQLVVFYRRDRLRYEVRILSATAVVSFAGTAALFLSGFDWGRWMHMQAVCLMLMLMLIARRPGVREAAAVRPQPRTKWARYAAGVALFVYATTWMLPSIGVEGERPGYSDTLGGLRHSARAAITSMLHRS